MYSWSRTDAQSPHNYHQGSVGVCLDVGVGVCLDVGVEVCLDVGVVCLDVGVEVCLDVGVGVCLDVEVEVCQHVSAGVCLDAMCCISNIAHCHSKWPHQSPRCWTV